MRSPSIYRLPLALLAVATLPAFGQVAPLPVVNGDFEQGAQGWTIPADEGICSVSQEQAASGKSSLKVVDESEKAGSNATAGRVPVHGAGAFLLHGKVFPVSGNGLGIYVRVLDRDGQLIGKGDEYQRGAPSDPKEKWAPFALSVYTPDNAAFLELWIHSYMAAKVTAYLDDFAFEDLGQKGLQPPWEGTYKIHPEEKAKLTAADVVGPDGVVYPDWRYAGIPGGIPSVPVVAKIEDFGVLELREAGDFTFEMEAWPDVSFGEKLRVRVEIE